MEVVDDVCESEGTCLVACNMMTDQPQQAESMETHVSDEEAAQQGSEHSSTAPSKPQYSYRCVFKLSWKKS